ncbi:Clp protease N-terminal domain-containing protein [Pseudonocardia lacus]|uniref:Clp protease N-terminal domain-containing protein n=1 Tax=Pseudonocardia lacus TaxID=2835865 RepID=UPI001BDBF733|nr:Clp protease N-terminal domain-containing protein [Pseudonocardia lacus]
MFERFTTKARDTVIGAQEVARRFDADAIGSEHLLAALYDQRGNLALTVLDALSVPRAEVEAELERIRTGGVATPSDAEALATLGIDLDEVRRQVEEAFGPGALDRTRSGLGRRWGRRGHLPFGKDAKKVLALALREAVLLKHNYIGCEHILLGMLHEGTGAAGVFLRSRGVRQDATRIIVEELLKRRRAG